MSQINFTKNEKLLIEHKLSNLFFLVLFLFLLILSRLFFLQILKYKNFKKFSDNNRIYTEKIVASRGKIFDSKGKILVGNRKSYNIALYKSGLNFDEIDGILDEVSSYCDVIDRNKIFAEFKNKKLEYITLAVDIPEELMWTLTEQKYYLRNVEIIEDSIRDYNFGYESAHIFGYVSKISDSEFSRLQNEGYRLNSVIGKTGLEKQYEGYLRGVEGLRLFEIDVHGKKRRLLEEVEPIAGFDLELTLDAELQAKAENTIKNYQGTIVVLEAKTSKILAMVSSPGYDANQFLYEINEEKISSFTNKDLPMLNRAIQGAYPPGSIFKLVTILAILEEKIISPKAKVFCSGGVYLGKENRYFRCWNKHGHGEVNMLRGFTESCDVYYYEMVLKLGISNLSKYAKAFGLDKKTGVDLPYELKNTMPDREWKYKRLKEGWYQGDTLNTAIGQGYLLQTPLSMAQMLATFLNRGVRNTPHLVEKIVKNNKTVFRWKQKMTADLTINDNAFSFLSKALRETVKYGTGRGAYVDGLDIGGKTGTAQNPHGQDHAWFVGCMPVSNPEIVVCVFIENGGGGGGVAAPLAREIFGCYSNEKADFTSK